VGSLACQNGSRTITQQRRAPRSSAASGVDVHNGIARYAWKIVDPSGAELIEGLDVAERDPASRLQRIVMFHGPLPPVTEPSGPPRD
jgi:hypothetical protein